MQPRNGLLLAIGASLALLLGLTACDNSNNITPEPAALDEMSSQFAVYEFDDEMAAIQEATLDQDMQLSADPPMDHGALNARRGNASFQAQRKFPGMHLGRILRTLNLTEDQVTQVRAFLQDYRTCIKEPIQLFREANREIIQNANQERRQIRQAFQNGELTRDEAKAKLQELNERTRQALQQSAENLGIPQAICDCKLALLENIGGILDADQKAAWDEWIAGLTGRCFTTAG